MLVQLRQGLFVVFLQDKLELGHAWVTWRWHSGPCVMLLKNPIKIMDVGCTQKLLYLEFKHDFLWVWSQCHCWDLILSLYRSQNYLSKRDSPVPSVRGTVCSVPVELWRDTIRLEDNLFIQECQDIISQNHRMNWVARSSSQVVVGVPSLGMFKTGLDETLGNQV